MPAYWRLLDSHRAMPPARFVERFRSELIAPHPSLFGPEGLGFTSKAQLDQAILAAAATTIEQRSKTEAKSKYLEQRLPELIRRFQTALPDFRCDFPIYLLPSLGKLDGAGRTIDGKPALLFGVDAIAAMHDAATIPVFVDHELFHRYHFQASGFSDDNAEHDDFWKSLWAEGLATYASMALNPPTSLGTALLDPQLIPEANPSFPEIVAGVERNFFLRDTKASSQFFLYHGRGANPPSRSGYYIGALAAQTLAMREHLTLVQLAHLQSDVAKTELLQVLPALQPVQP